MVFHILAPFMSLEVMSILFSPEAPVLAQWLDNKGNRLMIDIKINDSVYFPHRTT